MKAAQRAMRTARSFDVIDLEAVGLAQAFVFGMRARRRLVPAARAAITVAAFGGAPRERPPVILPKGIGTAVAAPRAASRRQRLTAPAATAVGAGRERANGD